MSLEWKKGPYTSVVKDQFTPNEVVEVVSIAPIELRDNRELKYPIDFVIYPKDGRGPAVVQYPISMPFFVPAGSKLQCVDRYAKLQLAMMIVYRSVAADPPQDIGKQVEAAIKELGNVLVPKILLAQLSKDVAKQIIDSEEFRQAVRRVVTGEK